MAIHLIYTAKGRRVGSLAFPAIRKDFSIVQKLEHEPKQIERLAALRRRKQLHGK